MKKDNLPIIILAVGGFVLFAVFFTATIWYMSNWANHGVRETLATRGDGTTMSGGRLESGSDPSLPAGRDGGAAPSGRGTDRPLATPSGWLSAGRGSTSQRTAEPSDGTDRAADNSFWRLDPPERDLADTSGLGAAPDAGWRPDGERLPDGTRPPDGRLPGGDSSDDKVDRRPRVAIVIDDWGYDWVAADDFLNFPGQLTVAVIPFLPFSQSHAEQALAAGHEVILHMPMEAQSSSIDLGPGGIRTSMADEEIADAVAQALATIPGVSGMNNHMGSRATGDERVMRAVLQVVAEERLFFLDSYTASSTVGPQTAEAMAVPHAVNQVFLDHEDTVEHVRGQIARLVRLAERQGEAIGIGHVRPNTYDALIDMLPELRSAGIELVPVSDLLSFPAGSFDLAGPVRMPSTAALHAAALRTAGVDGDGRNEGEREEPSGASGGVGDGSERGDERNPVSGIGDYVFP